eukprot:gnl/Dysnectes_brevis/1304_a1460_1962.p1 GENE.gnl/Dysnectes_brevis/1304_a1460_1962~~gnl/Dysnectes_brevis/1304_a1460_1962.p1  ORF type:complete len:367 (+),score=138.37 gnl/Dysnectes_brevis/1304_a1460_1962:99-1199(+)
MSSVEITCFCPIKLNTAAFKATNSKVWTSLKTEFSRYTCTSIIFLVTAAIYFALFMQQLRLVGVAFAPMIEEFESSDFVETSFELDYNWVEGDKKCYSEVVEVPSSDNLFFGNFFCAPSTDNHTSKYTQFGRFEYYSSEKCTFTDQIDQNGDLVPFDTPLVWQFDRDFRPRPIFNLLMALLSLAVTAAFLVYQARKKKRSRKPNTWFIWPLVFLCAGGVCVLFAKQTLRYYNLPLVKAKMVVDEAFVWRRDPEDTMLEAYMITYRLCSIYHSTDCVYYVKDFHKTRFGEDNPPKYKAVGEVWGKRVYNPLISHADDHLSPHFRFFPHPILWCLGALAMVIGAYASLWHTHTRHHGGSSGSMPPTRT